MKWKIFLKQILQKSNVKEVKFLYSQDPCAVHLYLAKFIIDILLAGHLTQSQNQIIVLKWGYFCTHVEFLKITKATKIHSLHLSEALNINEDIFIIEFKIQEFYKRSFFFNRQKQFRGKGPQSFSIEIRKLREKSKMRLQINAR